MSSQKEAQKLTQLKLKFHFMVIKWISLGPQTPCLLPSLHDIALTSSFFAIQRPYFDLPLESNPTYKNDPASSNNWISVHKHFSDLRRRSTIG